MQFASEPKCNGVQQFRAGPVLKAAAQRLKWNIECEQLNDFARFTLHT